MAHDELPSMLSHCVPGATFRVARDPIGAGKTSDGSESTKRSQRREGEKRSTMATRLLHFRRNSLERPDLVAPAQPESFALLPGEGPGRGVDDPVGILLHRVHSSTTY